MVATDMDKMGKRNVSRKKERNIRIFSCRLFPLLNIMHLTIDDGATLCITLDLNTYISVVFCIGSKVCFFIHAPFSMF